MYYYLLVDSRPCLGRTTFCQSSSLATVTCISYKINSDAAILIKTPTQSRTCKTV